MTERLYYHDSFLREFDAQVNSCEPAGERFQVVLDRTAFYPTSGGQPHDTGRLGDANVVDVFEREQDDAIVHITDSRVRAGKVQGRIDWDRRFDHMQQHTGQHLLSAAFLELFRFATVSFHLGRDVSTIDLAAPSVVPRYLQEMELRANRVIFEDRPITISFSTPEELADAGIRKAVDRQGILRVIEIQGFDRQPCGGTHTHSTGQIGLLLVRKVEKQKQNWRVEFVCGQRALRAARGDYHTLGEAAREIGCGMSEVPAMIARMIEERQAARRGSEKLAERLAELEAAALLAQPSGAPSQTLAGQEIKSGRAAGALIITHLCDDADANYLRSLAAKLVARPGVQALLATRAGGHVVFAQTPGLLADMNKLLRETLGPLGGKGGGSKDFAEGTVPNAANLQEALRGAREQLGNVQK